MSDSNNTTNPEISKGFCQCGCGGKTNIAIWSSKRNGWVKGEPKRFINNHHSKGKNNNNWHGGKQTKCNYITTRIKDHHKKYVSGYVPDHILIAEQILGKPIPEGAIVHHSDGNTHNNSPNNLVVCQDRAYHLFLHQRIRAYKACGHAKWLKCEYCKQYGDPINMWVNSKKPSRGFHRECQNAYKRNRYKIFSPAKL